MTNTRTYFENLDGLRFLAFLAVFVAHVFDFSGFKPASDESQHLIEHFFLHGDLGVSFFFVLSGFLITYLLLQEKNISNKISISEFYMRRILRIWPVYFLTIGMGFWLIPQLFSGADSALLPFKINAPSERLPWYLCFAANFDIVANGPGFLIVSVLWSVSVEEQFYLLWPLLNRIASRRTLTVFILLVVAISFYYRWDIYLNSYKVKYATFSVMNDLAIGSLTGTLCFYSNGFRNYFIHVKKGSIVLVYVILFSLIPTRLYMFTLPDNYIHFLIADEPVVFSVLFAFIIMEQNYSNNSLFKLFRLKPLNYLGKISYGLYSYHIICLFLTGFVFRYFFQDAIKSSIPLFIFQFVVSLAMSILLSSLSYSYFERLFLNIKKRFEIH